MTRIALAIVVLMLAAAPAAAQIEKGKYQAIEVTRFAVKEGVEFPPDYQVALTEALVKQLTEARKFKQVLREGETPSAEAPTLRLSGEVIEFKPGSRAKRYLVGFGAGSTKIVANIKVVDRASGAALFENKVDGKVVMGVVGGESMGAATGLAKEVTSKIKDKFF
jgi:hypothetical protein